MSVQTHSPDVLQMPSLYFKRTTPDEQERHRRKFATLATGGGLLIDPVQYDDGGWHAEIVTTDWEEPGLLDKIFEAVLKCIHVPGGIAFERIRVFTGPTGQVVNILELQDKQGRRLDRGKIDQVLEQLRKIRPGERAVLETIMDLTFSALIPMLTEFPALDNGRSEIYTYLEFEVSRISNRFTSMLLHFLARSEFRVNVQVAECVQGRRGRYSLWGLDKAGKQLTDSHFNRISMVRALEAMNRRIMGFNLHYIRKAWNQRIDRNEATIYRSRPDPRDFLEDLDNIRELAELKGFPDALSALVERRLLDNKAFYFLKKFESFCQENQARFQRLHDSAPGEAEVAMCREYFEQRRHSLRILEPLFNELIQLDAIPPHLSDDQRLHALCRPLSHEGYALDRDGLLYLTGSIWLAEPEKAFDPFLLMARTGCRFKADTQDAIEAALESWTPRFIEEKREVLGKTLLTILGESLRQCNSAVVLRNLRQLGLLQRILPGFDRITGMIHVVADHTYTVDEHSILVVEALSGLTILREVLPETGVSKIRKEYEQLATSVGLINFARKYAVEVRMLRSVPQLRSHPAIKPIFQLMDDVRNNNLEYVVEVNLFEHSQATCLNALHQIELVRRQLDPLIRQYTGLSHAEQRNLLLAALLHDMKKPDPDHGRQFAPHVGETLASAGLKLDEDAVTRIAWLVHHHLDLAEVMKRMGEEGDNALEAYMRREGGETLMRSLILFTYADRVAIHQDPNQASHNAMILADLLEKLAPWQEAGPAQPRAAAQ